MKISIRNKLIIFLVLPLFLAFSLLIFFSSEYIKSIVLGKYEKSHGDLMKAHSLHFNQVLKNAAGLVEETAPLFTDANQFDESKIERLLKSIIQGEDIILGAALAFEPYVYKNRERFAPFYFIKDGRIEYVDISNKVYGYDYKNGTLEWYTKPAKTKKSHWSEPFYSGVLSNVKVLTYSVPIIKANKFYGVLVVDFAVDKIDDFLKNSIKTETSRFAVISPKGTYISHPEKKRIIDRNILTDHEAIIPSADRKQIFDHIQKNENGYIRSTSSKDGRKIIAFYSTIPTADWGIIAYSYEEELTSEIENIFNNAYIILIGFFIIGFVLVGTATNKLLFPIQIIRKFSRKIAEGNYPENITSKTKDEFEDLIADLNEMNSRLQKRENELLILNKELEDRVLLRTKELNESLIEAKKLSAAVEQSPVLVTIADKEGKIEYVNPEYSKVTGFSSEEVKGKIHTLISTNTIDAETFSRYKRIMETGRKMKGEFQSIRKNGSKLWIRISGVGVADSNQEVKNFVFVEDDITDAKNAELKLKQQNEEIAARNKYITDSINYAKRIQDAILPSHHFFSSLYPNYFLIFSPKDVVSGDFYWVAEVDDKKIFAVIDCTGHGVPGALMSMIGNTLLNEIVAMSGITDPSEILKNLDQRVIEELQKDANSDTYDGMDAAIGVYNQALDKVTLASAYRTVLYFKNGKLNEIKGERKSIGDPKKKIKYTNHEIAIDEQTEIYLYTDGFVDQNNEREIKYSSRKLKNLLAENHIKDMNEQKELLMSDFSLHKRNELQRDDVTILGLRFMPKNMIGVLNYAGVFEHETIVELGEKLNSKLEGKVNLKTQKNIFFTVNELMQNICNYSETVVGNLIQQTKYGSINVQMSSDAINITASNNTTVEVFERVKSRIDSYTKLTDEQLKAIRKEKLKAESESNSKGAGIGLIEIIRRTKSQLTVSYQNDEKGNGEIKFFIKIKLGEVNG